MTLQVYRDVTAADGCEALAKLVFQLVADGFSYVAHSTGNGGSRLTSLPATAADLATDLRTAHSAWVCVSRGSRAWSWQRSTGVNPDYRSWRYEYTASGALSAGSATTPDRNATTSKYVSDNYFRVAFPGSGTGGSAVNAAMLLHIIVDDAGPTFFMGQRRTPLPVGNVALAGYYFCDELVDPVWAGNTDPIVCGGGGLDNNVFEAQIVSGGFSQAWKAYGLGGAAWTGVALENPGSVGGNTSADVGGIDIEYAARWQSPAVVYGTSRLFRLLQPYRTPVVGIDSGATLNRAAFGCVTVPNDGVALGS